MPRLKRRTYGQGLAADPHWRGTTPSRSDLTTEERYWWKVDVRSLEECWPWTGSTNEDGYGIFRIGTHNAEIFVIGAHRFAYLLAYGNTDPDLHIHHNCQNRGCVNPRHLEALTFAEHMRWHRDRRQFDAVR